MGTRALIHFKNEDGQTLTTLYKQHDGYPAGLGRQLTELFKNGQSTVVNGFDGSHSLGTHFNGVGCMTAFVISQLKTDIGGVYVYEPNSVDVGEEFTYTITVKDSQPLVSINTNGTTIFFGDFKDLTIQLESGKLCDY